MSIPVPKRANTIAQLLAAQPQLRPVLAQARQLAELQRIYSEIAPARLSRLSRVANIEDTTLIVFADGGAVAAKLKLLAPALINKFSLAGQEVTAIKVKVQAPTTHATSERQARTLPADARNYLKRLEDSLEDGQLKRALGRLIDNSK